MLNLFNIFLSWILFLSSPYSIAALPKIYRPNNDCKPPKVYTEKDDSTEKRDPRITPNEDKMVCTQGDAGTCYAFPTTYSLQALINQECVQKGEPTTNIVQVQDVIEIANQVKDEPYLSFEGGYLYAVYQKIRNFGFIAHTFPIPYEKYIQFKKINHRYPELSKQYEQELSCTLPKELSLYSPDLFYKGIPAIFEKLTNKEGKPLLNRVPIPKFNIHVIDSKESKEAISNQISNHFKNNPDIPIDMTYCNSVVTSERCNALKSNHVVSIRGTKLSCCDVECHEEWLIQDSNHHSDKPQWVMAQPYLESVKNNSFMSHFTFIKPCSGQDCKPYPIGAHPEFYLARAGDLKSLKELELEISKTGQMFQWDKHYSGNETLFHAAAFSGSPQLIEELLKKGIDPSIENAHGYSALWVAISRGNMQAAHMIISQQMKQGKSIDSLFINSKGECLSQIETDINSLAHFYEVSKFLINQGFDPEKCKNKYNGILTSFFRFGLIKDDFYKEYNSTKNSPPNILTTLEPNKLKEGVIKSIDFLIDKKFDLDDTYFVENLKFILNSLKFDDKLEFLQTIITKFITQNGNCKTVLPLLERVETDFKTSTEIKLNETQLDKLHEVKNILLQNAWNFKQPLCIKILLDSGANPKSITNAKDNSFFYRLISLNDPKILNLFSNNNTHLRDEFKKPIDPSQSIYLAHIISATPWKTVELQWLIKNGGPLNVVDKKGNTPLDNALASKNAEPEFLMLLLSEAPELFSSESIRKIVNNDQIMKLLQESLQNLLKTESFQGEKRKLLLENISNFLKTYDQPNANIQDNANIQLIKAIQDEFLKPQN